MGKALGQVPMLALSSGGWGSCSLCLGDDFKLCASWNERTFRTFLLELDDANHILGSIVCYLSFMASDVAGAIQFSNPSF